MHLTLINPPFTFLPKEEVTFSQCLGILYLASYARQKGHQVTIIDAFHEGKTRCEVSPEGLRSVGLTNHEIISRIPTHTGLIGVSVPFSHLAPLCHKLVEEIKTAFSSIPMVLGGVYPSTQPRLAMSSQTDFVVIGEGELPLVELMDFLNKGGIGSLPQGVIDSRCPESLQNLAAKRLTDLDSIPPPARDLLPFEEYTHRSQRSLKGGCTASIITSRGCPFDCEFCSIHQVCGYQWRPHSPGRVLAEIDLLMKNYQVDTLEIEDDNFTLNRDRAAEILEGIIKRNQGGRKISWWVPNGLRIDTLDEHLLEIITRSNCLHIMIALENGDEEMLRIMNKKLNLTKVLEVIKLIGKYKISCGVFIIYGYPGETRKKFENALSFYLKMKQLAPKIQFNPMIAQPYPGTKLLERVIVEGYLPPDIFSSLESLRRFSTTETIWLETPDFDKYEVQRRGDLLNRLLNPRAYYNRQLRNYLPDLWVDCLQQMYRRFKRFF